MMSANVLKHPLSPITKRTLVAVIAILFVMTIGTVGLKILTNWDWVDSFYFMSMVATAQGPSIAPPNFWSKIFVSIMAFISIGTLITSIGVVFGPFLGYVFHKGVLFAESEIEKEKPKNSH